MFALHFSKKTGFACKSELPVCVHTSCLPYSALFSSVLLAWGDCLDSTVLYILLFDFHFRLGLHVLL